MITAEARRLERLVADLLDLARLDAREFSLAPRPVDARAVVGATVQGFGPAAQEWGVQLQLTPGEPVQATIDPERLAQIVANLVENALKYASEPWWSTSLGASEQFEVRVDDDGPGIDPAERERVFQRLYTAGERKAARSEQESGSRSCTSSRKRWAATRGATQARPAAPASS